MKVTISEGTSFMITDEVGDVLPGKEAGLYSHDTRFLHAYEVFFNGAKPAALTGRPVDYYSAVHYLTNRASGTIPHDSISIARRRLVGEGLHEDFDLTNYGMEAVSLELRLAFDADFADIFEVKAGRAPAVEHPIFSVDEERQSISFKHEADDFYRETRIVFEERPEFGDKEVIFRIDLEPGESWHTCIDFMTLAAPEVVRPRYSCESSRMISEYRPEYQSDWIRKSARLFTDYDELQHAFNQGLLDMAALRMKGIDFAKIGVVPAAGIPWYVTCFGRDGLITAYQTLPYLPDIAAGVLRTLAQYQGTRVNPRNEEEPGKILHEIRLGRLATTGKIPHQRYFGTVDATLLFIIVLSEFYRWTADASMLQELKEPFIRAVEWIDDYGDKDGDGFIEYMRMADKGLENQGWKDSWDSVRFADGRFAEPPIALCEVQGYAYMAKLRAAEVFDVLGESERAGSLREQASLLREKFNRSFWLEEEEFFAEALDGDKQRVDAVTSNPGQLLWTGIVDEEKAGAVRRRLLAPDMFSGWGIRTMSSNMRAYNPISYHNGSVWPHDNSIIAAGLIGYGFQKEAMRVMEAVLEAGQYFDYQRLPELFCGFDKRPARIPIAYPTSSSPQAWASGSAMLMLTAILGMRARADQKLLYLKPRFPGDIYRIHVAGLRIGESYISFEVLKDAGETRLYITENPGSFKVKLEVWEDEHRLPLSGTGG